MPKSLDDILFKFSLFVVFISMIIPYQYISSKSVYVIGILIIITFSLLLIKNGEDIFNVANYYFICVLIALHGLSIFSAQNIQLSLTRYTYYLSTGILLYFNFYLLVKNKSQHRIFNSVILMASVFISVYGVVEFVLKENLLFGEFFNTENFKYYKLLASKFDYLDSGRIVSTVGHPVVLGFSLLPGTIIAFKKLIDKHSIINILVFTPIAVALFLTFTRGSWIAVSLPMVYLALRRKWNMKYVIVGILFCCSLIIGSSEVRRALMNRGVSSYINNPQANNRIGSYLTVSKIVNDSPLLGIGIANFRFVRYDYDEFGTNIEGPDNLYLMILAENGILGFTVFIVLLIMIIAPIKNLSKIEIDNEEYLEVYLLILFAFAINFFFFDALYHPIPRILFWSFAGLSASLIHENYLNTTSNDL